MASYAIRKEVFARKGEEGGRIRPLADGRGVDDKGRYQLVFNSCRHASEPYSCKHLFPLRNQTIRTHMRLVVLVMHELTWFLFQLVIALPSILQLACC